MHDDADNGPDPRDPDTLTRNWNELLQEIRVVETGVQILTGFLLTVPFSQRFESLDSFQRHLYLVVLAGAVATTALVVAPVAFHRILFRHRKRYWLVEAANQCARLGLVMTALTSSGVLFLVFDVVVGTGVGIATFVVSLVFFSLLWGVAPTMSGRTPPPKESS
ncbi:MAG: sodium:proton antiporter [Nocardioidaceae bacterium]|nr:sodium:proton antiporter [Nocardioidaceae bacterium]